MINAVIDWSLRNRFLVLLLTVGLVGWGLFAMKNTPLDAIPDLSDVQVIIKTTMNPDTRMPDICRLIADYYHRISVCHLNKS